MLELKNNECMSEQQELNNFIASELDTHQIILEYGRVLLDNDKEIRDKYKWITSIVSNRSLSISALLEFILPFITTSDYIFIDTIAIILLVLLALFISGALIYRQKHKKDFAKLINKKEKEILLKKITVLSSYISNLDMWIKEVGRDSKRSRDFLQKIKQELYKQRDNVILIENELSVIYGKIDPLLDERAREHAEARLQTYKPYIYV